MKKYPWEVAKKLAMQVKAKDFDNALKSALFLIEHIYEAEPDVCFDDVRFRMLQNLTIASRGAYEAGGNANDLFNINKYLIKEIINVKDKESLIKLTKEVLERLLFIVPELDIHSQRNINLALAYIKEHCTENITRKNVCKLLECSQSHLSRLLAKKTGYSFKQLVYKYRMEQAKTLLANTRLYIGQVAFEVGFSDQNYFTSSFKKIVGVTPSQFRRNNS